MDLSVDPLRLRSIVRSVLDRPEVELDRVEVRPSGHRVDNMTTAGLFHVHGTVVGGDAPWRVFAKVLQPARRSPLMAFVPPEHRDEVGVHLDWLDEPRLYRSALRVGLPDGLRLPVLHAIDEEEDEDRIVLWLEEVDDDGAWDLSAYRRAARALGRLSGRWPEARATEELGLARRDYGYLFFGKIAFVDLPVLASNDHWADPVLAALAPSNLRADLDELISVFPVLLQRLEALPHALVHGDAAPQNLLRPPHDDLVAIDWSYGSVGAIGGDLAQLLAGRFVVGDADPGEVPEITAVLLDAYLEGLGDEGVDVDPAGVEEAWATQLALRSGFSATVPDPGPVPDPDAWAACLARRLAVAQVAVDRCLATIRR